MGLGEKARRWWRGVAGWPARALLDALTRNRPKGAFDGIAIFATDTTLSIPAAEEFIQRTRLALSLMTSGAPAAYKRLHAFASRIVLSDAPAAPAYHEFLRAVMVPEAVGREADVTCYAGWLVQVCAAMGGNGGDEAQETQVAGFLGSLTSEERARVRNWLAQCDAAPGERISKGG